MKARATSLILVCALTGCAHMAPNESQALVPEFSVRPLSPTATASPFSLRVTSGQVQALIPGTWQAEPLPPGRFPREGFMASARLSDWKRGEATVGGAEAFWIDVGSIGIPSDYYYLVARGPALGDLATNTACQLISQDVYLDDRPDFTGDSYSAGDYVASGAGVCGSAAKLVRWEYVVVAPGYGELRQVGIPTSGLYVVIAALSGPRTRTQTLLAEMIDGMSFHNTSISQLVDAARHLS